jgi:hypothetical protein
METQINTLLSLIDKAENNLVSNNTKEAAEAYGAAIETLRTYLKENPTFPEVEGLAMYAKDIVRFRNEALSQYRAIGCQTGLSFPDWLIKYFVNGAKNWIHFAG